MKDVNSTYSKNGKPVNLGSVPADVWARKVIKAIQKDKTMLTPGFSATGFTRILSKGPRFLIDQVSKQVVK